MTLKLSQHASSHYRHSENICCWFLDVFGPLRIYVIDFPWWSIFIMRTNFVWGFKHGRDRWSLLRIQPLKYKQAWKQLEGKPSSVVLLNSFGSCKYPCQFEKGQCVSCWLENFIYCQEMKRPGDEMKCHPQWNEMSGKEKGRQTKMLELTVGGRQLFSIS